MGIFTKKFFLKQHFFCSKFYLLAILALLGFGLQYAKASHLVGGEIYYSYQGNNIYVVTMNIYRDCYNGKVGFDNPATVGIFDQNGTLIRNKKFTFKGSRPVSPTISQPCVNPPVSICYEVTTYSDTVILPDRVGGYQFSYQSCCRNSTITNLNNPANQSMTLDAQIPQRGATNQFANSNPQFRKLAPTFLCNSYVFNYDFSASDKDGDSLVYHLCPPYDTGPPYKNVNFAGGYNANSPFGTGAPVTFNSQTGQFSFTPNTTGQFVFAICVDEYRNGKYLSTTRRDVQVNITNCPYVLVSAIANPQATCANNTAYFQNNSQGAGAYKWDFGDPSTLADTSRQTSPNYTYPSTGTYTVMLVAFSSQSPNCSDTTYNKIEIFTSLNADFVSNINQCTYTASFTNNTNMVGTYTNSYAWSFGDGASSNLSNPVHTYSAAGTYVVTLTATNTAPQSCVSTATATIEIFPKPVADAGGSKSFCSGQGRTIGTAGLSGYSYSWIPASGLNDPNIAQPFANPGVSTTYTLMVTSDASSCKTTSAVVVTVIANPSADAGEDKQICIGSSKLIGSSALANTTYTWTPSTGLDNPNIAQPTSSSSINVTYTVLVRNSSSCTASDKMVLTVNTLPPADAGKDNTICSGMQVQIGTAGSFVYDYSWSPASGLDQPTVAQPFASPSASTSYTLTVSDRSTGCINTDVVLVNVNALPIAFAGNNRPICMGESTVLGALSQAGYSYQWSPGTALNNSSIAQPTASPSISTNYKLVVTNTGTGCSASDMVSVTVNTLPNADAGQDRIMCQNSTVLIGSQGQSSFTYQWSPAGGLSSSTVAQPSASPSSTTTYTLVVTNGFSNCTASDKVIVTVNPLPAANAGSDRQICKGDGVQIGSPAVSGMSYQWSPASGLNNANFASPIASPQISTVYMLTVTNNATLCSNTDNVSVIVNQIPQADAGTDKEICFGASVLIGSAGQSGHSYNWSPATGLSNTNTAQTTASPSQTTTYTLVVSNSSTSCTAQDQVEVKVNQNPIANAGPDKPVCSGNAVSIGSPAVSGYNYTWTPNNGLNSNIIAQPDASPSANITYTLNVSDGNTGCVASDMIEVTVNQSPSFDAGPDKVICSGGSASIGAANNILYTYAWTPANSLSNSTVSNPVASPFITTIYKVVVTSRINACAISDQVQVNVNPRPDVNLGFDRILCKGSVATIGVTGQAGTTYQWSPTTGIANPSSPMVDVSPSSSITYVLSATNNSTGCQASDDIVIQVANPPAATTGGDRSICRGNSTQLGFAGESGINYSWNPVNDLSNPNISNPIAFPNFTTTYFMSASNPSTGCTSVGKVTVQVLTPPTADAGVDHAICPNQTAQLGHPAQVGYSYTWSPPTGLSSTSVSNPGAKPPITTQYTLVVKDNSTNCTASDDAVVTIYNNPPVDAGSDKYICKGATASIGTQGQAGIEYSWTPPDYLDNSNQAQPNATPIKSITYIVSAKYSSSGCTSLDTMRLFIDNLPIGSAGPDQKICFGDTAFLGSNPTPSYNYQWTPVQGLSNAVISNPKATPTNSVSYVLTITNANTGCSIQDGVQVDVNELPLVFAGADQTVCAGTKVNLGSIAQAGYTYFWKPQTGLSNPNISNPSFTASATVSYVLQMTNNATSCSSTDTVFIKVNKVPIGSGGADKFICAGESIAIGSAPVAGYNYAWAPANTLDDANKSNPVASPSYSTIYTLTISDAINGCFTTDDVAVNVLGQTAAAAGSDRNICRGSSTNIGTVAQPGFTYKWSPAASLSNANISNPMASPTANTTYTVTVTGSGGSCVGTAQVAVTIVEPPIAEAGAGKTACVGTTVQIGTPFVAGLNYAWSPINDVNNFTLAEPTVLSTLAQFYTLTVTDSNTGCSATDQVYVQINANPVANAGIDRQICAGQNTQLGSSAQAGLNYLWSPATSLTSVNVAQPLANPSIDITYTLLVTNSFSNCSASDDVAIKVNVKPIADAGPDQLMCEKDSVLLGAVPAQSNYIYKWIPANGLSNPNIAQPKASPASSTSYTLQVSNSFTGCSASNDIVFVKVNKVPVFDAGADRIICAGSSTQIGQNPSPGYFYKWDNASLLDVDSIANPNAFPSVRTTFRVTVSDAVSSCKTMDYLVVDVQSSALADAGPDKNTCNGKAIKIGTVAQPGYSYQWIPANGLNNNSLAQPTAAPAATTTYKVIVSASGSTCTASDEMVVVIDKAVNAVTGPNQNICSGEGVELGGPVLANYSYLWSPAEGLDNPGISNPKASPTQSTTYTLKVTDIITNCSDEATVVVKVSTAPLADAGLDRAICPEQKAIIGRPAAANTTYKWSPALGLSNANISNPDAHPNYSTTYTLMVTSSNGCTASDQVAVVINPLPPVNAGLDKFICKGGSTQIGSAAKNGITYSWTPSSAQLNNSNAAQPIASPINTTSYVVAAKYEGTGCTAYDTTIVNVDNIPPAIAGSDQTICKGDTAFLGQKAQGAYNYQWSPTTGLDNAIAANPRATPTVSTSYSVTVESIATGCKASDGVLVSVNSVPSRLAGADKTICNGQSTLIGDPAQGGLQYSWSPATGLSNNRVANPVASPSLTTKYFLTVSGGTTQCKNVDTMVVNVNMAPIGNAGPFAIICLGDSAAIGSTPYVDNSYKWSPASTLNYDSIANPNAGPTADTYYSVTITNNSTACYTTDITQVKVMESSILSLPPSKRICFGSGVLVGVDAQANTEYTWTPSTGVSFPKASRSKISPTITTTYVLSAYNTVSKCSSSAPVEIVVDYGPQINPGPDHAICYGSKVQIGPASANPSYTYTWSPATGLSSNLIANPFASPIENTTYLLSVIDNQSKCNSVNKVEVKVTKPLVDAGEDKFICAQTPTSIGTPAQPNYDYEWKPLIGLNSGNTAQTLANPSVTTTYTVIATDQSSGCTASDAMVVNIKSIPDALAGTDKNVCANAQVQLGAGPADPLFFYSWTPIEGLDDPNAAQPLASPSVNTLYQLIVTDRYTYCNRSSSVMVTVKSNPLLAAAPDRNICPGGKTVIGSAGSGGNSYKWLPATALDNPNVAQPIANPGSTTTYIVEVKDNVNACLSKDTVIVNILPIPQVTLQPVYQACNNTEIQFGEATISGIKYAWSPGKTLLDSTVARPFATLVNTTSYTLTVSFNSTGCKNNYQTVVNVNNYPALISAADVRLCEGSAVPIGNTGIVGVKYQWSPGASLNDSTFAQPLAKPSQSTTYLLLASDQNSGKCVVADTVVAVLDKIDFHPAGKVQICRGGSLPIGDDPISGYKYQWSPATYLSATNVANPVAQPLSSITYMVSVSNANGLCNKVDTVQIALNTVVLQSLGSDTAICRGQSTVLQLDVPSPNNYTYEWSPASSLNSSTIAQPIANPTINTTYQVIITDPKINCSIVSNTQVQVNQLPQAQAGSDALICFGSSIQIGSAPEAGNTYLWTPAADLNDPNISAPLATVTKASSFVLSVLDTNNCVNRDTVFLDVLKTNIKPSYNAKICLGDTATIKLNASGKYRYEWNPAISAPDTASTVKIFANKFINYLVKAYQLNTNGDTCSYLQNIALDVSKARLKLSVANQDTACEKVQHILIAHYKGNSTYPPPFTVWSSNRSFTDTLNSPLTDSTAAIIPSQVNSKYYVKISNDYCSFIDSVNIVRDSVKISLPEISLCAGRSGEINLQQNSGDKLTYEWWPKNIIVGSDTSNPIKIKAFENGTLIVEASNSRACSKRLTAKLQVQNPGLIEAKADRSFIYRGETTYLRALPHEGAYRYNWSPATYLDDRTLANPKCKARETTTYYLSMVNSIDTLQCLGIDTVVVRVAVKTTCDELSVYVPNAFTPNDDGQNDRALVFGNNLAEVYFAIFNRWGEKIFESTNQSQGWDGTFQGKKLDPDVFVYYLKAKCADGNNFFKKGNITLVR